MNIAAFFNASPVIQIHALAALLALGCGLAIYTVARGRLAHRTLGVSMAGLVIVVLVSAFFIRTSGGFSLIHGLIPFTLLGVFGVAMGLARGNWKRHRDAGRGLVFGALLIPGLLTLVPGRLMHLVVFGG